MRNSVITYLSGMIIVLAAINVFSQEPEKSGSSRSKSSKLISKYDKSKDLTTVRIKPFTISRLRQEKDVTHNDNMPPHQMDLEIWCVFSGQGKPVAPDAFLKFHATANNYIFMRAQQVIAALDRDVPGQDRALPMGMTDYRSSPPKFNSVFEENMTVKIPADAVIRMAKASTVELFLGPVAYKLTPNQLAAIKELAGVLGEGS